MALRLGCAAIKQWQLDVFECAGARQEVEALKYEAEISPPQQGALIAVQPFDIDAAEAEAAAGRHIETAEDVHRGRLPRPGRTHHRDERSEAHTSELQSLMRITYAVFCFK